MESPSQTPNSGKQSPGGGQGIPTPGAPKQPDRQLPRKKRGGKKDPNSDVVGGADPNETDPERGERTP